MERMEKRATEVDERMFLGLNSMNHDKQIVHESYVDSPMLDHLSLSKACEAQVRS